MIQEVNWDLAPYAGKKLFLKVVDQSTSGWGHITADNFEFDAEVLAETAEMKPIEAPSLPDLSAEELEPPTTSATATSVALATRTLTHRASIRWPRKARS